MQPAKRAGIVAFMAGYQHNVGMENNGRPERYRRRGGIILGVSLVPAYFSTVQPLMRAFQGAIYVGYSRNFIILTTIGIFIGLAVLIFGPRLPPGLFKRPIQPDAYLPLLVFAIGLMFIGFGVSVVVRAILEGQGYRYL